MRDKRPTVRPANCRGPASQSDPAARASIGSPSVMMHVQLDRHVETVPIRQFAEIQLYLAPSAAALPTFRGPDCMHAPTEVASDNSRRRSLVFFSGE